MSKLNHLLSNASEMGGGQFIESLSEYTVVSDLADSVLVFLHSFELLFTLLCLVMNQRHYLEES